MTVEQIKNEVNGFTAEMLGENAPTVIDNSNIVDVGKSIQNLSNWQNKFITSLVNRIGRPIYVDRVYSGAVPPIYHDSWEYGSIMAKFSTDLPDAVDNVAWELSDGTTYSQDTFYGTTATAKFWNMRTTHAIYRSFLDEQLKDSFKSLEEMSAFISMVHNSITNSLALKNQGLIYRVISNLILETVKGGKTTQNRNLRTEYNTLFSKELTAEQCLHDPEFIRYANTEIAKTAARMSNYSELFNVESKPRFTPPERLIAVYHADFWASIGSYLFNAPSQFSHEYLTLPQGTAIPYWQGSGTGYSFINTSTITANPASGGTVTPPTGVIAVLFDEYAAGVTNYSPRVDTHYNAIGNFTNFFYKRFAGYFNDVSENSVVFTIGG